MVAGLKRPPVDLVHSAGILAAYRTYVSGLNVVSTETGKFRDREAREKEKKEGGRKGEERRKRLPRDLARTGGGDLGFGGVYNAINDSKPVTRP